MLHYLVLVTEDLFMVAALVSLLMAYCRVAFGRRGFRAVLAGVLAGTVLSAAMAVVKNTTKLIATNQWNFYIFLFTVALTLVFLVFGAVFGRGRQRQTVLGTAIEEKMGWGEWTVCALAAVLAAALLFYELPDVLAYPFLFDIGEEGILSLAFGSRLLGWLTALILTWIFARALYRSALRLDNRGISLTVLIGALLVNAVRMVGWAMSKWVGRPQLSGRNPWMTWLPVYSKQATPWAFPFSAFVQNNTVLFLILIIGIAAVIPLALFLRNLKVRGRWSNPAQLRRLKSDAKHARRIALTAVVCFAAAVVILTAVKAYDGRAVVLSEPEPYTVEGDSIIIDVENVNDGKLHRFELTSKNGITIRWIIVRKPTGAYGVGLDACDVCGKAGYYQRGDEIVCKRCDVVMNVNTIGFKGGCNPIPIPEAYELGGGRFVFSIEQLESHEIEFK